MRTSYIVLIWAPGNRGYVSFIFAAAETCPVLVPWGAGERGEKHGLDIHQTCLRALSTLLPPTHVILVNGLKPSEPSLWIFNVCFLRISKQEILLLKPLGSGEYSEVIPFHVPCGTGE